MRIFRFPASLGLFRVGVHLLYGALQVALLYPLAGASRRQRLRSRWSQGLLGVLGIRIEVAEGIAPGLESGLLVANHISFVDVFLINALLPSAFVAKSDVAGWPLIGWLARRNDTVFIERGNRKAAQHAREHMLRALGNGQRLAIFPEGTTTAGDLVLPFHGALFQGAIDAAIPVHALALSYHDSNGIRSEAPAYIDDVTLIDCLRAILRARGLVARVHCAASFRPPLPDRRHLAHHAHQAIARTLAHAPDPRNRGVKPFQARQQPLRNEAEIRQ
jgi:1-acyl-sn-glycerol-3-phosphate acyltransferase